MPRLVRGGKWVFGWVIVGSGRELIIPPAAWDEYDFRAGDTLAFLPGSLRSGGFGLSHPRLLAETSIPLPSRALAWGRVDRVGLVRVPAEVNVQAGDRLLVLRGSGRALGFVASGPIYQKALKHQDLVCFEVEEGE